MIEVYSIGHGTRSREDFIALLKEYQVNILADIRSVPYSRFNPQFNIGAMKEYLAAEGIEYIHFESLGGRPKDPSMYKDGKPDYQLMALQSSFRSALSQLISLAQSARICIMCSERKPEDCHRSNLVGNELQKLGIIMKHIDEHGNIRIENRLF